MSNTISIAHVRRNLYRLKIQNFVPQLTPVSLTANLLAAIPRGKQVSLLGLRVSNLSNEVFILRVFFERTNNPLNFVDYGVPARYVVPVPDGTNIYFDVPNQDSHPLDIALDAYSDTDLTVKFGGVIINGQVNIDIDFITT